MSTDRRSRVTEPQQDPDRKAVDEARMTFLEHLYDLRLRLRNAALIFLVATIGSFFFFKTYFDWLTRPARVAYTAALGREPMFVFTGPTEPFWVYTKLAMYGALLVSSPFIIWELWKFIAPGLYRKEKRLALLVTIATAVCFIGGALFGYALISKPALTFLFGLSEAVCGSAAVQDRALRAGWTRWSASCCPCCWAPGRRSSCRSCWACSAGWGW